MYKQTKLHFVIISLLEPVLNLPIKTAIKKYFKNLTQGHCSVISSATSAIKQ